MNWHEELLKRGFTFLESSTKTYGYKFGKARFTGSIVHEKWDGKFWTIVDEPGKNVKEIFCPFIKAEDEKRPNHKHQTVRLRNAEDLNNYIITNAFDAEKIVDAGLA